MTPLDGSVLPTGIRARLVEDINGLSMHVLEAGFDGGERPGVLLLHGFPELAYSWRKVMLPLAAAGYHVIAPDQRGYGRTTGWQSKDGNDYDVDLAPFRLLNLVADMVALVAALGHRSVAGVIGHDYGASVAAWCALTRPDLFRSLVLMSAPFAGPPLAPGGTVDTIHDDLAALAPPRKHYQWYYATRAADRDMRECAQGVHAFLRAYYHVKSADRVANRPFPLEAWTAVELAKLPRYYVMDLDRGMAETVAAEMPAASVIEACKWLPDHELAVYSAEYRRTGFQGGLQWYRCRTGAVDAAELAKFAGRTIDVPSCFISGSSDWGPYQKPGHLEKMQSSVLTRLLGSHFIDGAGHWVQQEQPEQVSALLLDFLRRSTPGRA